MPRISESRFRVRYAETDQMGMVYYANYFVWMEIARTDFCRDCGFSYAELEREEHAFLPVARADCRYSAPARYDDEIVVHTEITRINRRVIEFSYRIRTPKTLLAEGRTLHIVTSSRLAATLCNSDMNESMNDFTPASSSSCVTRWSEMPTAANCSSTRVASSMRSLTVTPRTVP